MYDRLKYKTIKYLIETQESQRILGLDTERALKEKRKKKDELAFFKFKTKNFCSVKAHGKRMKRQANSLGQNICQPQI